MRRIEEAYGGVARGYGDGCARQGLNDDAAGVHSAAFAGIGQGNDGLHSAAVVSGKYSAALAGIGQRSHGNVSTFHIA